MSYHFTALPFLFQRCPAASLILFVLRMILCYVFQPLENTCTFTKNLKKCSCIGVSKEAVEDGAFQGDGGGTVKRQQAYCHQGSKCAT